MTFYHFYHDTLPTVRDSVADRHLRDAGKCWGPRGHVYRRIGVYSAKFCAYDSLTVCFHYLFPFLILLVMYYIAHIDMVIFQVCLPSHSPLLLQYRAQNLGGKEMHSQSMVKVLMVVLANTSKE